jgi:hypothetical protein
MDYYDPMFRGTDQYHRHPIGNFLFTDSVKYFCDSKEAWWTLDVVGSYMDKLKGFSFLVLAFDVEDSRAVFTAREDSGTPAIVKQKIEYTDLSVSVKLFFEDGVLLFPSDH